MADEIKKNEALFPISVVKEITDLTARQIRYYEKHGLVNPIRNEGNRRIYSLNDISRFKQIKELIDQGVNIAGIKAIFSEKNQENNTITDKQKKLKINISTDEELHHLLLKVKNKLYGF